MSFLEYSMSINSFGAWAFVSGAPTPTARIWVFGYKVPKVAKNGIEPPSPYDRHFYPSPKKLSEA